MSDEPPACSPPSFTETHEAQLVCENCGGTGWVPQWSFVSTHQKEAGREVFLSSKGYAPCPFCARGRTIRAGGGSAPVSP
jgi:hypothetical protein